MTDQIRRAISASPTLRRAVKSRAGQHAIQTARGCRIAGPKFAVGQALGGTGTYRVRGMNVTLRHRTRDVAILAEIFAQRLYEPPADAPLTGPLQVLDLGGNIGLFGAYALCRWTIDSIVSFEPDPANMRLLETTAAANARWQTELAAVSNRDGTMRFLTGGYSESRQARDSEPGIDVRMVDVFDRGPVDLVKMDIEGGEWPILTDPRLPALGRVIVLEWHAVGCPEPDAHQTAGRMLRDAGYVHQRDLPHGHDGNGVMWAWR